MYCINVEPLNRPALTRDNRRLAVLAFTTRAKANQYLDAIGRHISGWRRRDYKVVHVARKKMALWCDVVRSCGARYVSWPVFESGGNLLSKVTMGLEIIEREFGKAA